MLLSISIVLALTATGQAASSSIQAIFARPVYSRLYNGEQYDLANTDRVTGDRVNTTAAAAALAALQPSYVCSLLYLSASDNLTQVMITDFNTTRNAVRQSSPTAKFDVELNLATTSQNGRPIFTSATQLVSFMQAIDSQLHLDGWWFDFYSDAQKVNPGYITAAVAYAHSHNQTIGGNVFDDTVPPGSDAVSFVDKPYNGTDSFYGFGWNPEQVTTLEKNTTQALVLGHLQSNPQNGNTTESCVYQNEWNSTRRVDYFQYWLEHASAADFKYMVPLFFPLCPGAYAFDPLSDELDAAVAQAQLGSATGTFYDYLLHVMDDGKSYPTPTSTASTTSSAPTASSTSHTSDALGSAQEFQWSGIISGSVLLVVLGALVC